MNRYLKLLCSGAAVLLPAGFPLGAETDSVSRSDTSVSAKFSLDGITIKTKKRRDLDPQHLTNPYKVEKSASTGTQVFTKEDIETLAPKDVFDLLSKASGMDVTYQGRKSPYFVRVRGGGSLTYILDGAVLPTCFNRILQKIPMSAIEEIKVIRGATSLALGPSIPIGSSRSGSGVSTGYVIIRTRQPQGTEASMSGFFENSDDDPVAHGQSLFMGTHLGNTSTEGFFSGINGYVGGLASGYDYASADERFDGTGADAVMGAAGLNFRQFSLDLMAYSDRGRLEMQRGVKVNGTLDNAKWYYDPLLTAVLTSNITMKWTNDQVSLFSAFLTKYDQTEHNEWFDDSTPVAAKNFKEETGGFAMRHNARFFGATLFSTVFQPSLQFTGSNGHGPNTSKRFNSWRTSVLGWSASVEQNLSDKVTIDIGYRWDRKHIDTSATSEKQVAVSNDVDMAPAQIVTAGAAWEMNDWFFINASYYHGYEGTAGDFDITTKSGDPLDPCKQRRADVSIGSGWKRCLRPTLTVFAVDMKNMKSATSDTFMVDGATYYYYTQSDAVRQGFELMLEGDIKPGGCGTRYRASWTHMIKNVTEASDGSWTEGTGLSSPGNMFTVSLNQSVFDWFNVNVSLKKIDPWTSTTSAMGVAADVHLGDYYTLDANIMKRMVINKHTITAKLYGRNITDQKYATRYVTGYYYARGATAGLELKLDL